MEFPANIHQRPSHFDPHTSLCSGALLGLRYVKSAALPKALQRIYLTRMHACKHEEVLRMQSNIFTCA